MWTTLGLIAALSLAPAQNPEIGLTNIRAVYWELGPARPDNKLIPGDTFFVAFDIDNVKESDDGSVFYGMGMEVLDSKNRVQFKQDMGQGVRGLNSLGGKRLPAVARVELGLDQPPGKYTLKMTVTDRAAKSTKSFTREFEVQPLTFGLVRLSLSSDPGGQLPAPFISLVGQTVAVNFRAVGFQRAKDQPNLTVELSVVDENDKPTVAKPLTGEVKELPKEVPVVPMQFALALNRPGKFTVKLKATDHVSKKTANLSFPITVLEPK
jgi:hypothetical protein